MFLSAYDTTRCSGYILTDTFEGIEKARFGSESPVRALEYEGKEFWRARMIVPGMAQIRPFAHPLIMPHTSDKGAVDVISSGDVIVDMRNFMRLDREKKPIVQGHSDYQMASIRTLLQVIWLSDRYRDLYNAGGFSMTLYIRWLSTLFVRRLNLPPEVQQSVNIILGYFYACMFEDVPAHVEKFDEKTITRMAIGIAGSTFTNVAEVLKRLDQFTVARNTSDLIKLLREHSGSQRFDKVEMLTIWQMMGGSFFGAKIDEILAVALEHPPTWLAVAYMASIDSSYRKVVIGEIAHNQRNSDAVKNFAHNVGMLCLSVRDVDYSPRAV